MVPKKAKVDYSEMQGATGTTQWKEDGPAQKELERLFKTKLIKYDDNAQNKNPCKNGHVQYVLSYEILIVCIVKRNFAATEENSNEIPELGASGSLKHPDICVKSLSDEISNISFVNPPYVVWTYTNHDTKCDYVCVTLPIISGSEDVRFLVSEDGLTLTINYKWLDAIYNPIELFSEELKGNLKIDDPKIHALRTHLLDCGLTPKSNPQGSIVISLPNKVRREEGTFTKKAIELADSNLLMVEFMAYQKSKIINELDTSIVFKKRV